MCFFTPGLLKHPSVIWQEEVRARSLRGHNTPCPLALLWGSGDMGITSGQGGTGDPLQLCRSGWALHSDPGILPLAQTPLPHFPLPLWSHLPKLQESAGATEVLPGIWPGLVKGTQVQEPGSSGFSLHHPLAE